MFYSFVSGMELSLLDRHVLNDSASNLMVDNERVTALGPAAETSSSAIDDLDIDLDVPVVGSLGGSLCGSGNVGSALSVDTTYVPLSASRLQLLQDTTMMESALDLDSLEDSSVGDCSTAGLIKMNGL